MSPRERVLCALNLGVPDRVPYCELAIDPVIAERLLGNESKRKLVEVGAYHATVEEEKKLSKLLHRDNIVIKINGPIYAEKLKGKDGRIFCGKGLIRSEKDLVLLNFPDPYDDSLYIEAERFAKNKGEFPLCFGGRLGISPTYMSMGMEGFSYALYDNPNLIEKVMDAYFGWYTVVLRRICQLDIDFVWSGDDLAYKTGPLFSPKVFRDLAVPRIKKLMGEINVPWVFHSDGNIIPFLDDLINLGVKGIHPIESAAMDINYVKEKYGDKICLLGNIDVNTLSIGTPSEVEEEVKKRLKDIAPGGGYIISSGNSLTAYCKPENIIAMVEAIQKYGKYPIRVDL